jgi:hypothetical protein
VSEPIRYTGKTEGSILGSPHWEHPEGEWVKYEDYEKLKAQIKRMATESIHDLGQLGEYSAENKLLRKELADAQENYHLVNEMVAKLIKESKPSV